MSFASLMNLAHLAVAQGEAVATETSAMQVIGAGLFGLVIGWYLFYINRHRKSDLQLGDLATLVGILGGAAVLAIFPQGSDLFAGYCIGLAIGFFAYFIVLLILVLRSPNFGVDYFIDGRRKLPDGEVGYPAGHVTPAPAFDINALGTGMELNTGKDKGVGGGRTGGGD
ncbi:MAG: hypothetical protein WCD37_08660 [Chloroflexia bacterium]